MKILSLAVLVLLACARSTPAAPQSQPEMVLQVGHNDEVDALAFTSDNRWLASGGRAQIKIWDAQSGALFRTIVPNDDARVLAWSPDNETLASGGYDTVTLWKRDGTLVHTFPSTRWHPGGSWHDRQFTSRVEGLAWSPDGTNLAIVGHGVEVWDVVLQRLLADIEKSEFDYTRDVAFAPDGATLAVSDSETIRFYDTEKWTLQRTLTASANIIYSADGRSLLIASDHAASWLNLRTGEKHGQINGLKERTWHTTYSANRKFIAYSLMDQHAIKIWNLETGQALPIIRDKEIEAGQIALSPDGSTLAAVTWANRDLKLWGTAPSHDVPVPRHADFIDSIAFSPDGSTLAVGGDNAHLLKWPDLTSKRVLSSGEVPLGGLQFSPDGQALYRFGREFFINFLQAWNLKTKQNASRVLTGKEEPVQCAAISFRRSLLAVAIGEGVQVRDLKNGKVLKQLKGFDAEVPSLSFSPDGNLLAAPEGRAVRVWNVQTGKPVKILTGCSGGVVHVAFSPDGKFLAARAHDSGVVHLWSTQTWKLHHSLPSHGGGHEGFVFSPDSRRLALNGKRGVFVHETQSGKQIAALKSITEGGMVQFSSDGRFLASTSSSDGALKLWRTGDWSPAATIVQWPVKKNTLPDWVAYTPEGYYTGSKDCEKYIRWRVDDELFPAKKYSKEFWRPDLVAEASKENP